MIGAAVVYFPVVCAPQPPAQLYSAQEAVSRWVIAAGIQPNKQSSSATIVTTTTEDGIPGKDTDQLTTHRQFHRQRHREFDQSELVLSPRVNIRKDWNGWLRKLEDAELQRQVNAAYVERALLFGPAAGGVPGTISWVAPEDATEGSKRVNNDIYILSVAPNGGTEVRWVIDSRTGLPLWSIRKGEDSEITEAYSDWKTFSGVKTPAAAKVSETNKPDYTWTRESVTFSRSLPANAFAAPLAGPPDATLAATIPPIPFHMESDHIIFDASVNGRPPMAFLLDTGDNEASMNASYIAELGLKPYAKSQATGGGGTADYLYAAGATFTLPGAELRNQHVAVIDETGLEHALGIKLAGLLGYDFISRFVLEIDYQKKLLYLHDPKGWEYNGSGTTVPVTFDDGIPFTHALISAGGKKNIPAFFVIDSGAQETMTLTAPFAKKNDLYAAAALSKVSQTAGLEHEFFSQQNVRGRIEELDLGSLGAAAPGGFAGGAANALKIHAIPVNMSVNKTGAYASESFSGTIGEGIYKRYRVFLDYQRSRVILEPTAAADQPFPERKTYGLTLLASGADWRTYTVTAVRKGSPAEQDGFAKGDLITAMDGKPASSSALGQMREAVQQEGTAHRFTVKRTGSEHEIQVRVRLVSLDQ